MGRQPTLAHTVILIVLTLALALALAGCVGPATNTHLSRLNAPSLRYLSTLSRILTTDGYARIVAVFEQRGSAEPQVLSVYQNYLEVTGLDGSGDHLIRMDGPCMGDAAVSPDGLWAACVFEDTPSDKTAISTYKLEFISLSPHGLSVHHAFELSSLEPRLGPIWSPDGRYLAVEVACVVEIFVVSPDASQLLLVGSFTSDALVQYHACIASGLSWSSDSTHLRLGIHSLGAYKLDAHSALAPVLAARGGALQIPVADFAPFAAGEPLLGPIWRPNANAALVTVTGSNALLYYTSVHQAPQVLLTMPDAAHQVLSAWWTPDGRQVVLTIGGSYGCVDACGPRVIPDMYLFTPTLST